MSAETLGQITDVMRDLVRDERIVGAVTMVSQRRKVVYCEAVGRQYREANIPMQRDTVFRIYSMTKPITSVAAMMLCEQGKLSLDSPLSDYVPELSNLRVYAGGADDEIETVAMTRPVTIRDLLRHTSGFTYGNFGITEVDRLYRRRRVVTRDQPLSETVEKLAEIPLCYQPGTKFRYSVSTDVLGHVIELVSAETLNDFFTKNIFEPLGMTDTDFHLPPEKSGRFAATYGPRRLKGGLRLVDNPTQSRFLKAPRMRSGGGGLVSTADDYMKFCHLLIADGEYQDGRLLSAESVAEMIHNQIPVAALPINVSGVQFHGVGFGLGFSVRVEQVKYAPYIPIGEYGWSGVASTHFWISPQDDLAVIVLTQRVPYIADLADTVKKIVYEAIE
jgi:CubicO group peptidase (beta-lactamase class C family)